MSNRRAAMRRDQRTREKLLKSKAPGSDILRKRNEGWEEGKILALCVGFEALYQEFGWRSQRLHNLADRIAYNSANCRKEVIKIVAKLWSDRLQDAIIEIAGSSPKLIAKDFNDKLKAEERANTYIAAASIVMVVLSSEYSFASNKAGTGRMDKIINRYAERYIHILLSENYYSANAYAKRIAELTGMQVA